MDIKKIIKKLVEAEVIKKYPIPPEIKDALTNKLKMSPLPRFVNNVKAINSIPPSYRIFLHNGQHFDISYEEFSLMIKIGINEYYIADLDERNYCIKEINKLLTGPIMKKPEEETPGGTGGTGEDKGITPLPTLPEIPEPEEPEA